MSTVLATVPSPSSVDQFASLVWTSTQQIHDNICLSYKWPSSYILSLFGHDADHASHIPIGANCLTEHDSNQQSVQTNDKSKRARLLTVSIIDKQAYKDAQRNSWMAIYLLVSIVIKSHGQSIQQSTLKTFLIVISVYVQRMNSTMFTPADFAQSDQRQCAPYIKLSKRTACK